jgi:pyruvate dehydrogenase E2 component (dihydrolipoamide acetyltransferase)
MAFEVVMPRLGWNIETGSLFEWLKQDGDRVEAGEILFTVESDKAIQEVEALESGILRIPPDTPPPGKPVPVGTLLAYLVTPGEELPFVAQAETAPAQKQTAATPSPTRAVPVTVPHMSERKRPAVSPRAARVASELGVDWTPLKGSGRTGRIVERDVRQAAAVTPATEETLPSGVRVSPVARRVAHELGVNLEQLAAQMPGKRIERADVEAAARKVVSAAPSAPRMPAPAATGDVVLPITQMRRITAERMVASAHNAASVTLTTEADATELVRLRNQLKSDITQLVPSYNDLLTKLVAQALIEHPQVNARFMGESIVQSATVNIGIAVDTERGLLVPVVYDVQTKSLRQIAQESAAMIERARSGRLSPDDLHGGTFTITNLGMYEIDTFTPIINLPECAILGVGRIMPKQVVVDVEAERVAVRHMMFLSLTFDHRLVDGAPAAHFLQTIKHLIECPWRVLV